jgi:UDP-N-acetylmuramoylalanine--D-glutamate ligase
MVGTFGGVTFIDDSYATTPDSAIGALSAFDEPIIWIAGGSAKGADFTELARRFAWGQKKAAILLGQEAPRLKAALERDEWAKKIPIFVVGSLAEAMSQATKLAKPGDVILLSPACASKDMFKDAADRGEQFQQLVRQWGADEHQI